MGVKEAKYRVVMDWITGEIVAGRLKPGDRLMSEEKLCEKFGLCRQTVRHATSELVKEEILTRLQGSGTYVGGRAIQMNHQRHMNIFVICTFYTSYIFPAILKGIEKTLSEAGYTMQVSFTDNKSLNEQKILKKIIRNQNIDGLILEPSESVHPNSNMKYFEKLLNNHIPILCFNDNYSFMNFPCVRLDDYMVSAKATSYLIKNGHEKIGGIFKLDDGQGQRRYQGYVDTLQSAGLKIRPKNIIWFDTCTQSELKKIEDYIFYRLENCTAVVCYNDEIAVQLVELAIKRGICVPEDLSIIGIDNSDISKICKVPVTSYPHPKEALGKKAAENLLKMIENPFFDGNYLFDAEVVSRNSVKNRSTNGGKIEI